MTPQIFRTYRHLCFDRQYYKQDIVFIGVREGILLGGRKKFALKVTFLFLSE